MTKDYGLLYVKDGKNYLYKAYVTIEELAHAIIFDKKFKEIDKEDILVIKLEELALK